MADRGLTGAFFVFGIRFFIAFVKKGQAVYTYDLRVTVGQLLSIPVVLAGTALLVRGLQSKSGGASGPVDTG